MAAPVTTNQLKFPPGYRAPSPRYSVFNGYIGSENGPGAVALGPANEFTFAAVPADLAVLGIVGPDGKNYDFQFVYNASVWAQGIKVPLPLSGATTAAQANTAFLTVVNAVFGTRFGGAIVNFPWAAQQTGAAKTQINWTVQGVPLITLVANITYIATAGSFGTNAVVPAVAGRRYALLPGY